MANSNTLLISLVKDAKSVCMDKFSLVKAIKPPDHPEVITIGKDMDRIFTHLDDPDIWKSPIECDTQPIIENMILGVLGNGNADAILPQTRKLLDLLDRNILQFVHAGAAATLHTSGMNIQMLDALLQTRRQIGMRISKFALAGQDLTQDADFLAMQAKQDPLMVTYRDKLKINAVNSTLTDVIIVKQLGSLITTSATVANFKSLYGRLTDFVKSKVTAV